ncbi:hypothetical protein C2I36_13510 [Rhodobacteraceae bacterium WD3A24]|nr:hypothetical protein C2I36_13510 [Rhodobacteraceae bacterium WD3A24]
MAGPTGPANCVHLLTSTSLEDLSIIMVRGDSMAPTLLDYDIVLLDRGKIDPSFDGLFVIRLQNALQVKRVGRAPRPDSVVIISVNRELSPPFEALIGDLGVVGKVLWYGRKV